MVLILLTSELLHVYTPSRTLRSSSDTCMLEIQQYKHKTHGFRTFSCFGPHIWNSLPQDLRHCSTLSSFKAKLKTFSSHSISILTHISTQYAEGVDERMINVHYYYYYMRLIIGIISRTVHMWVDVYNY